MTKSQTLFSAALGLPLLGMPLLASAGTTTQVVPFDYFAVDGALPVFELHDDMGGTRPLTGITLTYDQRITFGVNIEQNSPVAIAEGNFSADVLYLSIHQFGLADGGGGDPDEEGGGSFPPFIGPGAAGDIFSPGLGPTDGFNGSGPDFFQGNFDSGEFQFVAEFDANDPDVLNAFTGVVPLTTVLGGFTEIFGGFETDPGFPDIDPNNPPQGPFFPFQDPFFGAFVDPFDVRHQGTITATFTFVPEPASLTGLAVAGLLLRRRR
ncbi:MAG: hypothetical protein AAGD32_08605 [Planctomycetota bacterium]